MNALTTCNACGAAPMAPGQDAPSQPGLCVRCLNDAEKETAHVQAALWQAEIRTTMRGGRAR